MAQFIAYSIVATLVLGAIYLFVIMPIQQKSRQKENAQRFQNIVEPLLVQMKVNYDKAAVTMNIPTGKAEIGMATTVFGMPCSAKTSTGFYLWLDKTYLYIFPTEEHYSRNNIMVKSPLDIEKYAKDTVDPTDINPICIKIADIEYYITQGQIETELHVAGGGGGGSSLSGAVVGGLLGGEVGAIIGSRKEVQKVYSYTTEKDNRLIILVYKSEGKTTSLTLSANAYEELWQHIPEKDYNYINTTQKRQDPDANDVRTKVSVADEILKLADLRDKGILSEEEFNKKKKQLLEQ